VANNKPLTPQNARMLPSRVI